jgi:cytochrome c biogenesis protein CcmG/thiol:disulfide interchange protein DsbE
VARFKLFIPLLVFAFMGLFLLRGLQLDPRELPSALIDKPLPQFSLPDLYSGELLAREAVIGDVALLNVWATWCVSCRVEHPYLRQLADGGLTIYGLNYRDDSVEARRWLEQLGDPYRLNIVDADGTLGLDLGVYGAPETYLLDRSGVIRYRHVGVVNERVWVEVLEPLVRQLRAEPG